MGIRLIGAGLGRTGTYSLKLAIEQLTGGRCHHMSEVTSADVPMWHDAYLGRPPEWADELDDSTSTSSAHSVPTGPPAMQSRRHT